MKQDRHFLIKALDSAVHDCELSLDVNNVDWQQVYQLSMEQGVAGVVFDEVQMQYNCSHFSTLNLQLKLEWYAMQQQVEKQNQKVLRVLRMVMGTLQKEGITAVLLKGQGLAQLYPNPLHRAAGDIDVYIEPRHFDKVRELFAGMEFHEDYKHLECKVDGTLVEFHHYVALIPGCRKNEYFQKWMQPSLDLPTRGFFVDENCETNNTHGIFVGTLPTVENLVYTFIHAFFHFISEGLVLRQVMDFSLLLRKLNKEYSKEEAEKVMRKRLMKTGFLKPWQVFGCLLVKYLGFSIDEIPCYDGRYEKKADKVLEIIFTDAHKRYVKRERKQNAVAEYIRQCGCHLRLFRLFPNECIGFLTRMLTNTALKYV